MTTLSAIARPLGALCAFLGACLLIPALGLLGAAIALRAPHALPQAPKK